MCDDIVPGVWSVHVGVCQVSVLAYRPIKIVFLNCSGCDRRDMSVEEACELGRRAIYHATFRDAVSGGTVSGAPPAQDPAPGRSSAIALIVKSMAMALRSMAGHANQGILPHVVSLRRTS